MEAACPPTSILDLKVADIACGSGAFLVAAARYLADRLVEAWSARASPIGDTARPARCSAIREVVANCLYGADINAMAVEMCKLSLWLVSLDPKLPFSFVDDKVFLGNSLLGLTDVRQLEACTSTRTRPANAAQPSPIFDVDATSLPPGRRPAPRGSPPRSTTATRSAQRATKRRQLARATRRLTAHTARCRRRRDRRRAAARRQAGQGARRGLREPADAVGEAYPADGSSGRPDHARRDHRRAASRRP